MIYDFKVYDINHNIVQLNKYQNKIMLIVNVASHCGLKNQINKLVELQNKFKEFDLKILAFPSNDFLSQQKECSVAIKKIYETDFKINYDLFEKINVRKHPINPLYEFLISETAVNKKIKNIKWNFEKFLVDQKGNIVARFSPLINFDQIENEIKKLL